MGTGGKMIAPRLINGTQYGYLGPYTLQMEVMLVFTNIFQYQLLLQKDVPDYHILNILENYLKEELN